MLDQKCVVFLEHLHEWPYDWMYIDASMYIKMLLRLSIFNLNYFAKCEFLSLTVFRSGFSKRRFTYKSYIVNFIVNFIVNSQ